MIVSYDIVMILYLVQQSPALHALGPHLGLGCDVTILVQILQFIEAHWTIPVLGLGTIVPLLLMTLLNTNTCDWSINIILSCDWLIISHPQWPVSE